MPLTKADVHGINTRLDLITQAREKEEWYAYIQLADELVDVVDRLVEVAGGEEQEMLAIVRKSCWTMINETGKIIEMGGG